jgi:tetratricopeptide (TPR) repeat protein
MSRALRRIAQGYTWLALAQWVGAAALPAWHAQAWAAEPLSADDAKAREEALELFKQGRNAYKAGDYDAARELFQRAWARWDREPLIAVALAKAYDRAGQLEKAQVYYEHFLRLAPVTKDYLPDREQAVQRLAAIKEVLKSRPGVLKFRNLPSGARLEVDGKPVGVDSAGEVKVVAGQHAVRVTMEMRIPFEQPAIVVGPGETRDIEVVLVAPVDPGTLPRDHTWTWTAAGATTLGLVTTGALGFLWWQSYEDYAALVDQDTGQPTPKAKAQYPYKGQPCQVGVETTPGSKNFECDAATAAGKAALDDMAPYRIATPVVGGATVVLGILTYMAYVAAPVKDPNHGAAPKVTLQPNLGPGGGGLAVQVRF